MVYECGQNLIERYFKVDDKTGEIEVEHSLFGIERKLQDKGYGKKVIKMFYERYKKANINKITTFANMEVGGYAWAKYGFTCLKEELEMIMDGKSSVTKNKAPAEVKELVNKFYENNPNSTRFPMYLIANLENDKG
jgi:hypothetical protein